MNRILVTGSTGNVGRHVVDQLTAAGARFRAMTRDPDAAGLPAGVGRPIDRERATVLRMFQLLRDFVASLDGAVQVILTEHADPDVEWYDTAVVERWRGVGLIPDEWMKQE